jgi:colanic acid/amylovoran biosynthesis protein
MRILIEPGSYTLENVGDVAMLQVAARRLGQQWPEAAIGVVTEAPARLPSLCPRAEPVATGESADGHRVRAGSPASRLLSWSVWQRLLGGKQNTAFSKPPGVADALHGADLLVVSGMGALNDSFASRALRLLGTVERAAQHGVPVAFLSQGVGPVRDAAFRERLARALSRVELIAVRERLSGPPLLEEIGVSRDIVRVTGDDAVELAYEARPARLGTSLGINVRVAEYAGVDGNTLHGLQAVLRNTMDTLQTRVLPIPISHRHGGLDARTNRALLRHIDPDSDGGAMLLTPLDVIEQVGRCRLVITGSYHGGVFALAQGVPVIGLVNSAYYADKFLGLADMFGTGCEIVRLGDDSFRPKLADAIARGWSSAEHVRPQLLASAATQIQLGHDAYRALHTLIERPAAYAGR